MLSSFIEIITQFAFVPKLLLHSFCVNDTGLTNMHASKMYQNSAALAVFNKYVEKDVHRLVCGIKIRHEKTIKLLHTALYLILL